MGHRVMLKVKLKSLAEESRIIRKEERRCRDPLREQLYLHRIHVVREEARATHIAYGLIKGLKMEQIEQISYTKPNMDKVNAMVKKYGDKIEAPVKELLAA